MMDLWEVEVMIKLQNVETLENRIAPMAVNYITYGDEVTNFWNQYSDGSNSYLGLDGGFTEGFALTSGPYAGQFSDWTISGAYSSDIGSTLYTQIQADMSGTGASLLQASNDVLGLQNGMFVNSALNGMDPLRH